MAEFQMKDLENALEGGKPTAWHIEDRRLCTTEESYMAISHVWADGTGVGGGRPAGTVNQCLLGYFSTIAKGQGCVGVWWDTISVPERSPARGLALQNMHSYYRQAKCTVVHDAYLLHIPWREDGSPCIALVLSPWFTRGWTALELLVSESVKVIFKDGQIKDLKSEILAKDPASSTRGHWMATQMIRRLRRPVGSLNDLLAILSPRHTSWMRDRTAIAALLVGLPDFDPSDAESTTTQRIVSHLGKVVHAHLLHGKSTATTTGPFSWLPSTLDDIPVDFPGDLTGVTSSSALLNVSTNGVVEGSWFCRCVRESDVNENRVRPWGLDSAAQFKVDAALLEWENCLLLSPTEKFKDRVLLAYSCGMDGALECQYIATIASHDYWEKESTYEKRLVRIGGNAGDHISAQRAVKNTSKPHQTKRLSLPFQKKLDEQLPLRGPKNYGRLKVEYPISSIPKPPRDRPPQAEHR
ncbi:hypothetical protein NW754_000292 [Fusarium falciforme]|nr:hypothetical protein NW754_000292 [Fusarium falciforme]